MKSNNKFLTLLSLANKVSKVPGDIMMSGVAQGGDVYAILFYLACTNNLRDRQLHAFDTWEGLPAAKDVADAGFDKGDYHVGFDAFLQNGVEFGRLYDDMLKQEGTWKDLISPHVKIHKGLFADTMPSAVSGKKVALLSCDGDMYQSTMDCLNSAAGNVAKGGAIYQDDYFTFLGNYKAVQDYRAAKGISDNVAPMYVVSQEGDPMPIMEQHGNCQPPVDNNPKHAPGEGICGAMPAEA